MLEQVNALQPAKLANLENLNDFFIEEGMTQSEQLQKLDLWLDTNEPQTTLFIGCQSFSPH